MTPKQMRLKAAQLRQDADALDHTATILDRMALNGKQRRIETQLGKAARVRVTQTAAPEPKPEEPTRSWNTTVTKARRRKTAKGLQKLASVGGPVPPHEAHKLVRNLGPLTAYGYVKKENGGYVRTDKPFTV
jgi:hypothetical protein